MLESLLPSYGYPVLIIGTFLEGETIMVLAGVAAHLGRAVETVLGDIKKYEVELMIAIIGFACLIWFIHFYRRRTYKSV